MIAEAASRYGVDNMNVLFLTPLPGTSLWKRLMAEGRIAMNAFPEDWKYYTLNYPVARYKYVGPDQIIREMKECNGTFYSAGSIFARLGRNVLAGRNPFFTLVSNLTSRRNSMQFARIYESMWQIEASEHGAEPLDTPHLDLVDTWDAAAQKLRSLVAILKAPAAWFFRQS